VALNWCFFPDTRAADDGVTVMLVGAGVPLPPKESTISGLEVLLVKAAVPLVAPVACGMNVTVKCRDLPASMVVGNEMPLRANSGLLRLTEETVTLVPVALSVTGRLALVPITTLPKSRVERLSSKLAFAGGGC
jgi:hypothetical protein